MAMQISEYIDLYKNGGYIREMRKYIGHAPLQVVAKFCCKREEAMVHGRSLAVQWRLAKPLRKQPKEKH